MRYFFFSFIIIHFTSCNNSITPVSEVRVDTVYKYYELYDMVRDRESRDTLFYFNVKEYNRTDGNRLMAKYEIRAFQKDTLLHGIFESYHPNGVDDIVADYFFGKPLSVAYFREDSVRIRLAQYVYLPNDSGKGRDVYFDDVGNIIASKSLYFEVKPLKVLNGKITCSVYIDTLHYRKNMSIYFGKYSYSQFDFDTSSVFREYFLRQNPDTIETEVFNENVRRYEVAGRIQFEKGDRYFFNLLMKDSMKTN